MMRPAWQDVLRSHADDQPDAIALVENTGARITRAELSQQVESVAAALSARGFEAGDHALFSVRPGIEAVVLVLAIHQLHGVLIPMDPGIGDALFDARMTLLAPRWVFAESVLLVAPAGLVSRLLRWRGIHFAALGTIEGAAFVRVGRRLPGMPPSTPYRALLRQDVAVRDDSAPPRARARIAGANIENDASDASPAFIVCTSGTTADPKAVVHTRASLRAIVAAVARQLTLAPTDVMFARDLHLMLPALLAGARVIIPRDRAFDGVRTLDLFERHRVSHAFLVTRDCRLLLDACTASGRGVPDCLRSLMIGAAPVRAAFLARLAHVLPAQTEAWCVYGATEVLPVACVALAEKVAYDGPGDLVGAPLPGVTVRVDDSGQLCIAGDRLCAGYVGHGAMTEYPSGDRARLDGERIVLLGRQKDMLIRGDHNIYPELYESLVERVSGVRRAAIVGDFDPVLADERIVLVVEPDGSVDEATLLAAVARSVREGPSRFDATAQPDRIVALQSLPEAGRSHKIDKAALRRMLGVTPACA